MLQGALQRSLQQATRLARTVRNLLDVRQVDLAHVEVRPEPCDLAQVVRAAVEECEAIAPERALRVVTPAEPVPALANPDRANQVVASFLSNALKFSPTDQPIEVIVETEGEWARMSVRDHGPGLPLSEQERVWERFYRTPSVPHTSGSEIGLGLFLSKALVERHGGRVGVESDGVHGATFWFALPTVG